MILPVFCASIFFAANVAHMGIRCTFQRGTILQASLRSGFKYVSVKPASFSITSTAHGMYGMVVTPMRRRSPSALAPHWRCTDEP